MHYDHFCREGFLLEDVFAPIICNILTDLLMFRNSKCELTQSQYPKRSFYMNVDVSTFMISVKIVVIIEKEKKCMHMFLD